MLSLTETYNWKVFFKVWTTWASRYIFLPLTPAFRHDFEGKRNKVIKGGIQNNSTDVWIGHGCPSGCWEWKKEKQLLCVCMLGGTLTAPFHIFLIYHEIHSHPKLIFPNIHGTSFQVLAPALFDAYSTQLNLSTTPNHYHPNWAVPSSGWMKDSIPYWSFPPPLKKSEPSHSM